MSICEEVSFRQPKKKVVNNPSEKAAEKRAKVEKHLAKLVAAREIKEVKPVESGFRVIWEELWVKYYKGFPCISWGHTGKAKASADFINRELNKNGVDKRMFLDWVFSNWKYIIQQNKYEVENASIPTIFLLRRFYMFIVTLYANRMTVNMEEIPEELKPYYDMLIKRMPHDKALAGAQNLYERNNKKAVGWKR